ncbi:MAG: PaaI family thioesterase [Acidobacteriia bacterium]|nr:PaaI family thioesterase [Terriglobia bacterium]
MLATNFNLYLGIRILRKHPNGVTVECRMRKELLNFAGVLHGGVTATLADVAVGQALMQRGHKTTTVELKINYLRPITGSKVTARSHLLRIGKTLSTARVDVFDDRKNLAAVALVTYMLLEGSGRLIRK